MQRTISIFCALTLAVGACSEDESGSGIGRRPVSIDDVERPVLVSVAISEVYATPVAAADREVELLNTGTADVDVTGFSVCAADLCDPVIVTDIAAGAREVIAVPTLDLAAGVGEAALVDADGLVHAYVAWGADPSSVGSSLAAAAAVSGATDAGVFVALPYPFPTGLDVAIAWEGSEAGCALPSSGSAAAIDAALCPPASAPVLAITEVLPWTPDPTDETGESGDSWIEIHNLTGDTLRLAGVRVCHVPVCGGFTGDVSLAGDGYMVVHFGGDVDTSLPDDEVWFPNALPVGTRGEVAILAPGSADITDPAAMQSFVRYGPTAGELSAVAVSAGLWPEIFASAREPRIVGESLSHDLTTDLTADAWYTTTPTPKAVNDDIGPISDLWTSCSWPRPWAPGPVSDLVIQRVFNVADEFPVGVRPSFVIENRGSDSSVLDNIVLNFDGQRLLLAAAPNNPLPAGDTLLIDTGPADACTAPEGGLCFPGVGTDFLGMPAYLPESAEMYLTLEFGSNVILLQYLYWGEGTGQTAADAAAANIWPLERCSLPPAVPDTVLTLAEGADGHSPPDFF